MATGPLHPDLIEQAKKEREKLLRQIDESQRTIARSREILAKIDAVLSQAGEDEK
jgi:hypothetical protein